MSPLALDDTIAAIATAPGAAGLAVLRVSGPSALAVADAVFRGPRLAAAVSHSLHHGWIVDATGARLDEGVAAVFRAPRSYTREDVVEFSCHGGAVPAQRVLAALAAAGARRAEPGEFTLRAFLHGRLDLAQAEAVADLIHAETHRAADLALSQLAGALSEQVAALRESVLDARAEVEARVDFADDVGGVEVPAHIVEAIARTREALAGMLAGGAYARALRSGVQVALVGRPNVGKSSLFNALLGEARALVTPIPGTTRDRVSEAIEVAGVRVTLSDTAGLRASDDPVERLGIERSWEALTVSACVLWVLDAAEPMTAEDEAIAERLAGRRVVVALNKCDRPAVLTGDAVRRRLPGVQQVAAVSAHTGEGLEPLRAALVGGGEPAAGWALAVANPRHEDALRRAEAALARAAAAAPTAPGEIVALELREAQAALGEVTGETVDDDLLARIFARFCIGK